MRQRERESQSRPAAASNMLGCQIEVGMRWRQITPAALTTGCPNDKQPNETKCLRASTSRCYLGVASSTASRFSESPCIIEERRDSSLF